MIKEWIKEYLAEHTDIILANPQDYIDFIEALFMSYNINTTINNNCLYKATILQFKFLLENTHIMLEVSSNIQSEAVTNYSVSYKNTYNVGTYFSPLAFNLLISCGLISSIVDRC